MNFSRFLYMWLARLSPRTMLLICLALAGLATYLYSAEIQRREKTAADAIAQLEKESSRTARVLTAARDIKEGAFLHLDDLRLETVPFEAVPRGAVQDVNSVLGMRAKFDINAGEAIFNAHLGMTKQAQGFEAKIPAGHRAVTFAVDTTSGVAGFVAPDSHVDIIAQVGSGAEVKSCPILADVRVIAAGTTYKRIAGQEGAQPVSSVTVAVSPANAGKLINAIAAGRLYLTLRNDEDHAPLAVRDVGSLFNKAISIDQLPSTLPTAPAFTLAPPAPPALNQLEESPLQAKLPVPANPHTVELWSGSKRDELAVSAQ